MRKINKTILCIVFMSLVNQLFAQIPYDVDAKKGKIVYFSDGNGGDIDDVGANAFTLYTLSRLNLQEKVGLYVYSDKFGAKNSNNNHEKTNKITVDKAISSWGFNSAIFKEGDDYFNHRTPIVNKLVELIDNTSENNPLYIVFAGEGGYSYTYEAFEEASANKLKNVTLISHSLFNEAANDDRDKKDGNSDNKIKLNGRSIPLYSYIDLENDFETATYYGHRQVLDQNGKGASKIEGFASNSLGNTQRWLPWNWLNTGEVSNVDTKFIYQQMQKTIALPNKTKVGKADISDFGMVWFMLTGNKKGNPYELKEFFKTGLIPKPFYLLTASDVNGSQRKLSSNYVFQETDFFTERNTNGKLKPGLVVDSNMVGNNEAKAFVKWFKIPTDVDGEYLIVNGATGLALISPEGNKVKSANIYDDTAVWTLNNSVLTNKATGKEIKPQSDIIGSEIEQTNNGVGNMFQWNFLKTELKENTTVGNLSQKDVLKDKIKIYINDTQSLLFFEGEFKSNYTVSILTITGKVILQHQFKNTNSNSIDVSDLSRGCYIFKVMDRQVSTSLKFLK